MACQHVRGCTRCVWRQQHVKQTLHGTRIRERSEIRIYDTAVTVYCIASVYYVISCAHSTTTTTVLCPHLVVHTVVLCAVHTSPYMVQIEVGAPCATVVVTPQTGHQHTALCHEAAQLQLLCRRRPCACSIYTYLVVRTEHSSGRGHGQRSQRRRLRANMAPTKLRKTIRTETTNGTISRQQVTDNQQCNLRQ